MHNVSVVWDWKNWGFHLELKRNTGLIGCWEFGPLMVLWFG
jgi:hypothetical protein